MNNTGSSASNSTGVLTPGCRSDLSPQFHFLCDVRSVWGIVVQALTVLGFLISLVLLLLVLFRWVCGSCRRRRGLKVVQGSVCASAALFLLAVTGLFGLPFSFVVVLTERTCPVRVFLFGVLFGLAFSCLLVRVLATLGWAVCRGSAEVVLALVLTLVQVVIAVEWLLVVLVRDGRPCYYSQEEFVMLLIYVMVLLTVAAVLSLRLLCCSTTYSYSSSRWPQYHGRLQGALLSLSLLLSAAVWVVWISLLTRGNPELGRRPAWDDPVISIALTANGWVLLLGHGLNQVRLVFCSRCSTKTQSPEFTGWTSTSQLPNYCLTQGAQNPGYQPEPKDQREKGKGAEPVLKSPYPASSFSMTKIDPDQHFTIPRPQTTNITQPYDDYYTHTHTHTNTH